MVLIVSVFFNHLGMTTLMLVIYNLEAKVMCFGLPVYVLSSKWYNYIAYNRLARVYYFEIRIYLFSWLACCQIEIGSQRMFCCVTDLKHVHITYPSRVQTVHGPDEMIRSYDKERCNIHIITHNETILITLRVKRSPSNAPSVFRHLCIWIPTISTYI